METNFKSELDPVTFEVLKNGFINLVDQMGEQLLRTCYSFVIYNRDFSSALCDAEGNTVMQGTKDIAAHVGTLHLTAKAVIDYFKNDIHPGDVFLINDPYRGGTHLPDIRVMKPIFHNEELIAFVQSNGHWADVGGRNPGSVDITLTDYYGEGVRIPPLRVWSKGDYLSDVAELLVSNMRIPEERLGDLWAQEESTKVGEKEVLRLINKYGKDTVLTAFEEVQDYVERLTRSRLKNLPNGSWETIDYIDKDPTLEEGMIPIKTRMTIDNDKIIYDFEGTHPPIATILNSGFGTALSAVYAGTKAFFPDIPMNSGLYRVIEVKFPENSVVNVDWPISVAGSGSGSFEKILNSCFELWSYVIPERALACSFNLEYLLIGGLDKREGFGNYFMWYDWMAGGHGSRSDRDGANSMSPVFGMGLSVQPIEGQERLTPVVTSNHEIITDSGGPGKFRGGCGVEKGGTLTSISKDTIMSVSNDRERSVTWGIYGGLPSIPHGLWLNPGKDNEQFLGALFSNIKLQEGDSFLRPSAGGGGLGDPLERSMEAVLEDVIDKYVSIQRAEKDYGVVVKEIDSDIDQYEIDLTETKKARKYIRNNRLEWLNKDVYTVFENFKSGKVDKIDLIRRYGVLVDFTKNKVLDKSTRQFREMLQKRSAAYWK